MNVINVTFYLKKKRAQYFEKHEFVTKKLLNYMDKILDYHNSIG